MSERAGPARLTRPLCRIAAGSLGLARGRWCAAGRASGVRVGRRKEERPGESRTRDSRILLVGGTRLELMTSSVSGKRATNCANRPRWRRDLNPCTRICSPLPRLSATPPARAGLGSQVLRPSPSGRRDSNPRPSPWQGDALPAEPRPHAFRPGLSARSARGTPYTAPAGDCKTGRREPAGAATPICVGVTRLG